MAYMHEVYDTLEEAALLIKALQNLYTDSSEIVDHKVDDVLNKIQIILKEKDAINVAACARV